MSLPTDPTQPRNEDSDNEVIRSLDEVKGYDDAFFYTDPLTAVKHLHTTRNLDVNCDQGYEETVLISALQGSHVSVATYLLQNGADPNIYYHDTTPLTAAAENSDIPPSVVSDLLAHGARVEHDQALYEACLDLNAEKAKVLLEAGMSPNKLRKDCKPGVTGQQFDETPLHAAVDNGWIKHRPDRDTKDYDGMQLDTVKVLMQHGADVNMKDSEGRLVLDKAKERGLSRLVEVLEGKGKESGS